MPRQRLWFIVHSWLGLKLAIILSFILITGTLAVFSYEIDWLLNHEMRVSAPDGVARDHTVSWGTIYDSARSAYPDGRVRWLARGPNSWWATQAVFDAPDGTLKRVWINPFTGAYQGATEWFNVQRFLRQTHRHLMMPTAIGIPLVCVSLFPCSPSWSLGPWSTSVSGAASSGCRVSAARRGSGSAICIA